MELDSGWTITAVFSGKLGAEAGAGDALKSADFGWDSAVVFTSDCTITALFAGKLEVLVAVAVGVAVGWLTTTFPETFEEFVDVETAAASALTGCGVGAAGGAACPVAVVMSAPLTVGAGVGTDPGAGGAGRRMLCGGAGFGFKAAAIVANGLEERAAVFAGAKGCAAGREAAAVSRET